MIMISKNVIGIYEGGGGRIAAGGGLFAGGLFAAGLIAGGLFVSGLNAAPHISRTYITPTPETTSTHDIWLPPYTPDVYHTYP